MTNSQNKTSGFFWIVPLALGTLALANVSHAQEKPRSLVPSFVGEQAETLKGSLPSDDKPSSGELPSSNLQEKSNTSLGAEGSETLVVEKLDALNPASAGLLTESNGGFSAQMWSGTPASLVRTLLGKISHNPQSPEMMDLYRRLLLTGVVLPGSNADNNRILRIRLQKLRDAGRVNDAQALLARIPLHAQSEELQKVAAELDLLKGNYEQVCLASGRTSARQQADKFWSKVAVFCRLSNEEFDRAELGAALLEEQGENDPLFFALFARLAGDDIPVPFNSASLRPLDVAMIDVAKIVIDPSVIPSASPEILEALLRNPQSLGDRHAEVIFNVIGNDISEMGALRKKVQSDIALKEDATIEDIFSSYANLFKTVVEAEEESEKAVHLSVLLQLAIDNNHFASVSKLVLDELSRFSSTDYGREFNLLTVKALLLNGKEEQAAVWERLIRRSASLGTSEERLQARSDITKLDTYMVLSGVNAIARWNGASFAFWKNATDQDPDQGIKSELLLSLLEVFGYAVSEENWRDLLLMNTGPVSAESSHTLERNLISSASAGRKGETIALALQALGQAGPEGVTTTTLIAVTSALKAIGLEKEARNLAVEAAIAKGF